MVNLLKKILSIIARLINRVENIFNAIYFKEKSSWEQIYQKYCSYDSAKIINKVTDSARLVRDGKAAYERDGVIFDEIQYNTHLLSSLLVAIANLKNSGKKINIVDFGGALGTNYFAFKDLLLNVCDFNWIICEQEKFVEIGKKEFEKGNLFFCKDLAEVKEKFINPDIILCSCVLSYLKDPYGILQSFINIKPHYIIIDRTPMLANQEIASLQKVPDNIYKEQYPVLLLNNNKIEDVLSKNYKQILKFTTDVWSDRNYIRNGFKLIPFKMISLLYKQN